MAFTATRTLLPIEVLNEILDHAADDHRTLAACARASPALLPRARTHLWRDVAVYCDWDEMDRDLFGTHVYAGAHQPSPQTRHVFLDAFAAAVDATPALAPCVRTLRLYQRLMGSHRSRFAAERARVLGRLTGLRTLTLDSMRVRSLADWCAIVRLPLGLEELVCRSTAVDVGPPGLRVGLGLGAGERAGGRELALRRVTMQQCMITQTFCALEGRQSLEAAALEQLQISGGEHAHQWYALIRAGTRTLRHLVAVNGEAVTDGEPATSTTRLFGLLRLCSGLRYLGLRHQPHNREQTMEGTLLQSLCELLESDPPLRFTLENLMLLVVERNGVIVGVTYSLVDRLAKVLLDRRRFPAFKRLTVWLDGQIWMEWYSSWILTGNVAVMQERAKTLRDAFEAFGDHVEVKLRCVAGGPGTQ
ncbi:uncharacterized protein BXZ73DRAFT_99295 [Epithele typhae]|uniref:uncharacterized protein n=1 Tax=Epithele typhae TaxID=378194 RepID=UPI0020089910|nr:uncharacterized protein BXZ73DRAFT_99295 [Epithele typhae]KAH9939679.1 hypothetical protein BXZ73DRAFT_99295 [Epithele typhae]